MSIVTVNSALDFIKEIEKMVKEKNVQYYEAVVLYCEKNDIEIETIAALVKQNSALKSKIQIESENANMIKKTSARLPL